MTTETKSNTISLSLMAALIAALVTGVTMGAYAVIQYKTEPEATISDLVLRHGWHVLGLGVLL